MVREDATVTRSPTVQGGAAVLAGTRMPIGSVVAVYRQAGGDLNEVRAAYPHLTKAQIQAALTYYERHRAEIEQDEARNRDAFGTLAPAS